MRSFRILSVPIVLFASVLFAQTNPQPFNLSSGDYSLTEWSASSPAGTYPPNMQFHRGPLQDPGPTAEPNADYAGAYDATSGTRMNGLGTDGFSWRNIGSGTPPGDLGAAVLALNTTGLTNVHVSWTGGTVAVDATTREYRIRLQYRVGTSGNFTDVPGPIEYITATVGHSQSFGPTLLPPAVSNQPVVQLRWKYYYVTGSNTRPQLRVGNILVQTGQLPGDGTGTARVLPDTLTGGTTGPIQIIYRRDTQVSVNGLRIIVPPAFTWSHSTGDVSSTNMTATSTVVGDTVTFTNVVFSADSGVVTLANITSPDSTAFYTFKVQSKENAFKDIASSPRMVVFGSPVPIADVKMSDANGVPLLKDQPVTVRGIVTVANEFNSPSYIQDNSAGMAVFGSSFSSAVSIGEEVVVSGLVQPFNGLFEIVNPKLHAIVSTGNVVEPQVVTATQIASDGIGGVEQYEGLLVRLNRVMIIGQATTDAGGKNYPLSDATGTTVIRISNATELADKPLPAGAFDLIAVVGQFKRESPFIGGYQLMPRFQTDIVSSGPIIESLPVESNIQPTSLTISWRTVNTGTTRLRYGTTPAFELGLIANDNTLRVNHSVALTDLAPATIYYVKSFSVAGSDTSFASTIIVSTASPPQSTGQTNVYFNKSVHTAIATFQPALGNENLVSRVVPRINNAKRSIDAALYSLSGTPGNTIASAMVNARIRGVKVRVICEDDKRNTPAYNTIANNGIPLITDRFDSFNNGEGLHHNKFFVFDARGGAPESVWVWTGSWNPTQSGTDDDFQNSIEIQDVSLANAFTREFEEEWGSSTDVPNAANSRFGARKLDNTPHRFVIGGRSVECYFSPSDRTTSKIVAAVSNAQHSVGFALYSFTRSDIANAIIGQRTAGLKTRGTMDNSGPSEQYNNLLTNGVDVRLKTGVSSSTLLHHKYAVLDAESANWNSVAITGSMNWSNNGESFNNENTLIIYDANIANQYLQEFAARYYQFGGTDVFTGLKIVGETTPNEFSLSQNYPNPFNPRTSFEFRVSGFELVRLVIYDLLGREVATLVNEIKAPGTYRVRWDGAGLPSGIYYYRLTAGALLATKKMVLLK